MTARERIRAWLANLDKNEQQPRTLDAEGFCTMCVGQHTVVTLAVPAEGDQFLVHAPMLSLRGAQPSLLADFYATLLGEQMPGILPLGLCYCVDTEGGGVFLLGRHAIEGMDAMAFERTLTSFVETATAARPRLLDALHRLEARHAGATDAPPMPAQSLASTDVSDDDLVRMGTNLYLRV